MLRIGFAYFDYKYFLNDRLLLGVRIVIIVIRVVVLGLLIAAWIAVCLPCIRRRPRLAEFIVAFSIFLLEGGTFFKLSMVFSASVIPEIPTSVILAVGGLISVRYATNSTCNVTDCDLFTPFGLDPLLQFGIPSAYLPLIRNT